MRSPLTDDDPLDFSPTARAGFAFFSIDAEIILKIAAAVDPIEAGAVSADRFGKRFPDRAPERLDPFNPQAGNAVRRHLRMNSRAKKRFVRINIAQSRDKPLIEEKRFNRPRAFREPGTQIFRRQRP